MDIQKFTQNSLQAVQNCERLAYDYGNQEIDQEHLFYSLLSLEDSLILKLLVKMGLQQEYIIGCAQTVLKKKTRVSGQNVQLHISNALNQVLIYAEDEAKQMGDEYVSVEHLFLSLLERPNREMKDLFKSLQINREKFLQALSTVRGNQRVTSDNPEATYDTLKKYAVELVEKAGKQELDPVIGRAAGMGRVKRTLARET